jgi:hypothetical protein
MLHTMLHTNVVPAPLVCGVSSRDAFGRRAYAPKQIDLYVIDVLPADVGYVSPVKHLGESARLPSHPISKDTS